MIEMAATVTSSLVSSHQREEMGKVSVRLARTLGNYSNHTRIHGFLSAEYRTLLSILGVNAIFLCHRSRPPVVYGSKDITLTTEEYNALLDDVRSKHTVMFSSLEGRGLAFFSVRSFVVVFARGSIAREVKWAGKPDTPLQDQERLHPRASFEMFLEESKFKVEPWSPATTDLLAMVRNGVSSYLYEEALPSDIRDRVAHICHELRTPFHGVMGSLDILHVGHADMSVGDRDEVISSAILCGNSMMSTLDDILDIAKDRHHIEVASHRFFAWSPIHLTKAALKHFAAKNNIELTTTISAESAASSKSNASTTIANDGVNAGLHDVFGDEHGIKHILQNLVNNAIKFTSWGGKVNISLLVFDSLQDVTSWWNMEADRFCANAWIGNSANTDCVEDLKTSGKRAGARAEEVGSPSRAPQLWHVYCVEDTGVGILEKDLSVITKAYRQVSEGVCKEYQGTGLGLHISLTRVEAMLGRLGVASTSAEKGGKGCTSGGGTLFAVALPLHCPEPNLQLGEAPAVDSQEVKINAEAVVEKAVGAVATIVGASSDQGDESGDGDNITGPRREVAFFVVDDHTVNVKLMTKKIERVFKLNRGAVKVLSATDGLTALDMLLNVRDGNAKQDKTGMDATTIPAGVFMDYHMPNMDGVECTRRIRLLEAERGWPR